jgi:hypothetical protein
VPYHVYRKKLAQFSSIMKSLNRFIQTPDG